MKKYHFNPVCKRCNNLLILDDIDYRFNGCQDEYWLCETCKLAIFVKVRFNKVCKVSKTYLED